MREIRPYGLEGGRDHVWSPLSLSFSLTDAIPHTTVIGRRPKSGERRGVSPPVLGLSAGGVIQVRQLLHRTVEMADGVSFHQKGTISVGVRFVEPER